jgi:hypothetical protein
MTNRDRGETNDLAGLFDEHFSPRARGEAQWRDVEGRLLDAVVIQRAPLPGWRWPVVAASAIGICVAWLIVSLDRPGESTFAESPTEHAEREQWERSERERWVQSVFFPPELSGAITANDDDAFYTNDIRLLSLALLPREGGV